MPVLAIWSLRWFPYSCFLYQGCTRGWETAWTLWCSPHRHEDLSLVLRTQRKSPCVECMPVTQCWGSKDTWTHGMSWLAILAYLYMRPPHTPHTCATHTRRTHAPPPHPTHMHPHTPHTYAPTPTPHTHTSNTCTPPHLPPPHPAHTHDCARPDFCEDIWTASLK